MIFQMLAVTEAPIIFLFQSSVKKMFVVTAEDIRPRGVLQERSFDLYLL